MTPSRTTRISTEDTGGAEGPHPFWGRASVTYLEGCAEGVGSSWHWKPTRPIDPESGICISSINRYRSCVTRVKYRVVTFRIESPSRSSNRRTKIESISFLADDACHLSSVLIYALSLVLFFSLRSYQCSLHFYLSSSHILHRILTIVFIFPALRKSWLFCNISLSFRRKHIRSFLAPVVSYGTATRHGVEGKEKKYQKWIHGNCAPRSVRLRPNQGELRSKRRCVPSYRGRKALCRTRQRQRLALYPAVLIKAVSSRLRGSTTRRLWNK